MQIQIRDSSALSAQSLTFLPPDTQSRVFESRLTISAFNPPPSLVAYYLYNIQRDCWPVFSCPGSSIPTSPDSLYWQLCWIQNPPDQTRTTSSNLKGGCPHKSCVAAFSNINFTFFSLTFFFTLIQLFHINSNPHFHISYINFNFPHSVLIRFYSLVYVQFYHKMTDISSISINKLVNKVCLSKLFWNNRFGPDSTLRVTVFKTNRLIDQAFFKCCC